jgi:hypothetical protein
MNERLKGLLTLLALGGLVGGGIVGFLGYQEWIVFSRGSPTPQRIRLADLTARGPGDNVHVEVTDFVWGQNCVTETKQGKWNRVWIPIFPSGAAEQGQVRALVKTFHVADEGQLHQMVGRQTVTGVIDNVIPGHGLGSAEIAELKKGYPNADLAGLLVIEEGRTFPGPEKVYLLLGIGGGLLVLGLAAVLVLVVARLRHRTG